MQRIVIGDEVIVTSGSQKGARGQVEKIVYGPGRKPERVVIGGVNFGTKHKKPNPAKGDPGGLMREEMPVHVSNVALFNEEKGGADKVRIEVGEDGTRTRVFASGGNVP